MNIFNQGQPSKQTAPSTTTPEIELLQDRLRKIDQRLAELEIEITKSPTGAPAHAELLTEQHDLTTLRRTTDIKVRSLLAPPDAKQVARQKRRAALVARREKELRDGWNAAAENFARQGDFYSARQMRWNSLHAAEFAAKEFER